MRRLDDLLRQVIIDPRIRSLMHISIFLSQLNQGAQADQQSILPGGAQLASDVIEPSVGRGFKFLVASPPPTAVLNTNRP